MTEPPPQDESSTTYECDLTEADYRAFRRHVRYRHFRLHWYYAGLAALILALTWFGGEESETPVQKLYTLIGGLIVFGGYAVVAWVVLALYRRISKRRFIGPLGKHVFVVSNGGLRETSDHGSAEIRVHAIRCVDETAQHFFVITDGGVGYVLPKRGHTDFAALHELRSNSPAGRVYACDRVPASMAFESQGDTRHLPSLSMLDCSPLRRQPSRVLAILIAAFPAFSILAIDYSIRREGWQVWKSNGYLLVLAILLCVPDYGPATSSVAGHASACWA